MSLKEKDEVFDYYQEVARSAFADMLHDTERNQKYSAGLKEAILTIKSRGLKANVLDIGTGTGLLAMLAAQHGADSVVTIEAFSPVSHIARKIIEQNGFKDKIKIINKHSTEIRVGEGKDMEQRANILVAEVLDTELIGEGAVKTYNHAHKYLMESDCLCVPESASIYVQIVDCPTAVSWNSFIEDSGVKCPENVSNCSGAPSIHDIQLSQLPLNKFKSLAEPLKICDVDFSGKSPIPNDEKFTKKFKIEADGEANAAFFWWEIKMNSSGSLVLSCAPFWAHPDLKDPAEEKRNSISWRDHWMQACFYLQPRNQLKNGNFAFLTACHDEFSWWLQVTHEKTQETPEIDRPMCTCMFHIINSRNRILEINSKINLKNFHGENLLFLGNHNLMALKAAVTHDKRVFLLEKDSLCYRSMKNFIDFNRMEIKGKFQLLNDLEELEDEEIDEIVGEPHYNSAVLPWDNFLMFWMEVQRFLKDSTKIPIISPAKASIHAIPVNFLNLHKIRWPLKSSCEGFDHQIFDKVIEIASSLADENVEPFSLWEYPCIALGSSTEIFSMNMNDKAIKETQKTIKIEDFSRCCNGIALWVEFDNTRASCASKLGELVDWQPEDRQGVHLISSANIEAGRISGVTIKTSFKNQNLVMEFSYEN